MVSSAAGASNTLTCTPHPLTCQAEGTLEAQRSELRRQQAALSLQEQQMQQRAAHDSAAARQAEERRAELAAREARLRIEEEGLGAQHEVRSLGGRSWGGAAAAGAVGSRCATCQQ